MEANVLLISIIGAVLLVFVLLIIVIVVTKKGPVSLDVRKYRSSWMKIEAQLKKNEPASYHMCIINADKLLGKALLERKFSGDTMGERIKSASSKWTNINSVWAAHRLRNRVAHEVDVQLDYDNTRRALATFKRALKDIGAI